MLPGLWYNSKEIGATGVIGISSYIRALRPNLVVAKLEEINLADLRQQGKRGLILDLDNTISPWKKNMVTDEADSFIKLAVSLGYKVCLLSNAGYRRAEEVASDYEIPFVAPALKPLKRSFQRALLVMGLAADEVVVVGDQLFTDVLGGNRAGCYTILVPPLAEKEFIWTRLMRLLEKRLGYR